MDYHWIDDHFFGIIHLRVGQKWWSTLQGNVSLAVLLTTVTNFLGNSAGISQVCLENGGFHEPQA